LAEVDERILGFVEAWKGFLKMSGFQATLIEHRVVSRRFAYAGTLDRFGDLEGIPTVIDIKSGEPPAVAALQTAAYTRALEETDGVKAKRRVAVHVGQNGKFKVKEYCSPEDDRIWLMALSVHRWLTKN
jgi:hypothetical protein